MGLSARVLCDYCGCPPARHQREEEEKREGLEELTAELTLVKEEVAEERKSRLPQPDEEELHLWPHVQAHGLGLKTPGSKSAKKTSEEVVVDLGGDEVSGKQELNLLEERNVEEVEANVRREQESGDNSRCFHFPSSLVSSRKQKRGERGERKQELYSKPAAKKMGGNVSRGIRHSTRDGGSGGRGGGQPTKGGNTGGEVKMPARLEMLLDMPYVNRETQVKHAWSSEDRSLNIFVKEDDKLTFHRHPVAQSTDCIRAKVGYERGLHLFEITWSTRQRGTHAVVGVSSAEAPLHSVGYQSLVGNNEHSWGWDLGRNKVYHNSKVNPGITYPSNLKHDETFVVPDKFLVMLDMDEGVLGFVVDGKYLGPAFRGLRGKKLYLMVSAVWGHCEITMKYLGGLDPEPLPLMDLCRRVIRQTINKERIEQGKIAELNLPKTIKDYLEYKDRRTLHSVCLDA